MKKQRRFKRLWSFVLVIVIILAGGCGYLFLGNPVTDASSQVTSGRSGTKSLVVYFSRTGEIPGDVDAVSAATENSNSEMSGSDTEAAAQMIQQLTGADMYQIRTKRYYRKSFAGTAARAWIEDKLNTRPALAAQPKSLDQYDTIYVGYPIWWFNAPMAIGSFLESYNLSGKKIVPFCTSQDNDIEVSMDYIKSVASNADVLEGCRIHNMNSKDVKAWLQEIGVQ